MVLAANAEGAVDDHGVRSGKGGIDVAADHGRLPGDVALACSACEQNLVLAPVRMNERGLRGKCFCHGEHGRKRFDLDVDRRERGFGLDQRVGGDRRQRLAVVADQVAGEERVVGDADPDLAGGIRSRHNRADARHASGLGDVETDDASRRHAGA